MDRFLEEIEEKWELLERNIQSQMDAAFLFFGFFPAVLSMLIVMLDLEQIMLTLALFALFYVLSSLVLITYLDEVQVQMRDEIDVRRWAPVSIAMAFTSAALLSLSPGLVEATLSIALPIAIGLAPMTLSVFRQIKEINELEESLKRFLRDLVELMRVGYSIKSSIRRLNRENYGRKFDKILSSFISGLKSGRSGMDIVNSLRIRSKLVKTAFAVIAAIIEVGGGLSEVERLENFTLKYLDRKKRTFRNSLISLIVAIFIPLLGLFGIKVFEEILRSLVTIPQLPIPSAITPLNIDVVITLSKFLILLSSIITGVILGKMISGTVKNTIYLSICLIIYSVGLSLIQLVRISV